MNFLEEIKTLLRDHDRAFIPGFGGFVKEYVPARIDPEKDLFLPPSCTISFNTRLAKEDGLLAERIMELEGKDFEKAKHRIQEFANEWQKELERKKRIELKGIGIIYLDEEGKKRFEPDPDPELEPSAYGLEAFHLAPAKKADQDLAPSEPSAPKTPEKEEESSAEAPQEEARIQKERSGTRKFLRAAAILVPIILLLSFGAALGIHQSTESAEFLNPLSPSLLGDKTYQARSSPGMIDTSMLSRGFETDVKKKTPPFSFRIDDNGPEYRVLADSNLGEREEKEKKKASYYIVGGCFEMMNNARSRLRTLSEEGYSPRILEEKRNGLHVVVFSAYADRQRAMQELRGIRSNMRDAWLLHQP